MVDVGVNEFIYEYDEEGFVSMSRVVGKINSVVLVDVVENSVDD